MDPHLEFKGLLHYQSPNPQTSSTHLSPTHRPYSSLTNINMHTIESSTTLCHQNSLFNLPLRLFSPSTPSLSIDSNSLTEPRSEFQLQTLISSEKRLRRMQSNRESARRSRMRRKKQIEELQANVNQLQSMNHQLSEKVIHLLETNHQILQENSQLKEKISSLNLSVSNLWLIPPMKNVEDSPARGDTFESSIGHH